jgi:hypothetical protein
MWNAWLESRLQRVIGRYAGDVPRFPHRQKLQGFRHFLTCWKLPAQIPFNVKSSMRGLEPERCGSPFLFDRVKKLASLRIPTRPAARPTPSVC